MKFYPIAISKIQEETKECKTFTLAIPEKWKAAFQYDAGQHLIIRYQLDGKDLRRNYSLCSSPLDDQWTVAIKKVPNGVFSNYAHNHLKEGDVIEVSPPIGRFIWPKLVEGSGLFVAFAAGSGITPILSIIKTTLKQNPRSRFMIFYSNADQKSIIFHEQLEKLKNQYTDRFSIFHIFTRQKLDHPFFSGRINEQKIKSFQRFLVDFTQVDLIYLCGPGLMMDHIIKSLKVLGVLKQKIKRELFMAPKFNATRKDNIYEDMPVGHKEIKIIHQGKEIIVTSEDNHNTVLELALQSQTDLPFACKGGVCATCKARLEEGEVQMKVNYALEPDEIENGFILTCQSLPKSDKLIVSYD